MRLLRIDKKLWDVLAVEDENGESVWTWLERQRGNRSTETHARKMRALLREHLPRNGPPRKRNQGTVLKGSDGICELKTGPKKGPKLRVLYFYDGSKRIICSHGFWKDTATARREIRRAEEIKKAYLAARRKVVRELAPPRKDGPRAVT